MMRYKSEERILLQSEESVLTELLQKAKAESAQPTAACIL